MAENITLQFQLNLTPVTTALKQVESQVKATGKGIEQSISGNLVSKIRDLGLAYQGLKTVVSDAVNIMKNFTAAALEADKVEKQLAASLKLTGQASAANIEAIKDLASATQAVTTADDEAIISGLTLYENISHASVATFPQATQAALGLAEAYNMDLNTAFMLLGRAAMGQTQMLTRYGIAIDMTASKEAQYQQVLAKGIEAYPLAEAAAKTYEGQLKQLNNTWADMMETLGNLVLPIMQDIISIVRPLVEAFTGMHAVFKALVIILPIATAAWIKFALASAGAGVATGSFTAAITAAALAVKGFWLSIGPVGWALLGLTAAATAAMVIFGKKKKSTDELTAANEQLAKSQAEVKTASEEMTEELDRETGEFDVLVARLEELRTKTYQTQQDKLNLSDTIKQLNDKYGVYIGNINLEAGAWRSVAAELANARDRLIEYKMADIFAARFNEQLRKVAELQIQLNDISGKTAAQAATQAELRAAAEVGRGHYGTGTIAATAGLDYLEKTRTDKIAKLKVQISEEKKLLAELQNAYTEAVQNVGALPKPKAAAPAAGGAKEDPAEQQAVLSKQRIEALNAARRVWEERQAEQAADTAGYYEQVKFLDANYYDWKAAQINKEVAELKLSTEQQAVLSKQRIEALNAEKAAYEKLPQDELLRAYDEMIRQFSDQKELGVISYEALTASLKAYAEKIKETFGAQSAEYKAALDAMQVAQMNWGANQERLWREQHEFALGTVDAIVSGFRTGWDSMLDTAMTGRQRLQSIWTSIRGSFMNMVGQMAAEWVKKQLVMLAVSLTSEKAKQAAIAETGAVETAFSLKSILLQIKSAGAKILGAIASGFKWLIETLGPFGLAAGIALGGGIIAAFGALKKQLGFAAGGLIRGLGGPTEDNIPIFASNGEYVINAAATKKFLPILEQINNFGKGIPAPMLKGYFAQGGMVTGQTAGADWDALKAEISGLRRDLGKLELQATVDYGNPRAVFRAAKIGERQSRLY